MYCAFRVPESAGAMRAAMRSISETKDYTAMAGDAPAVEEEGRLEPRLQGPFPARVKGLPLSGERFVATTVVENLSAYHCSVRLAERVDAGDCLFVAARIYRALILLRARVLQPLMRADGTWDVALRITRYRFIHRRKNSD